MLELIVHASRQMVDSVFQLGIQRSRGRLQDRAEAAGAAELPVAAFELVAPAPN
jgi:hypothetical protein